MSDALLEAALRWDDDKPNNECPGCGHDITGWGSYPQHYTDPDDSVLNPVTRGRREVLMIPWPFTGDSVTEDSGSAGTLCAWTRDHLSARYLRRLYILEHA